MATCEEPLEVIENPVSPSNIIPFFTVLVKYFSLIFYKLSNFVLITIILGILVNFEFIMMPNNFITCKRLHVIINRKIKTITSAKPVTEDDINKLSVEEYDYSQIN